MIAETICAAVSAAGLGIAAVTAYRKRFLTATKIAAFALVPIGLAMTGVVKWVAHTAFSPTAWAGFGVLAVAVVLWLVTRAVDRRLGTTRKERRQAKAARREAVAPDASAPSLTAGGRPAAQPSAAPRAKGGAAPQQKPEDFSDIEAILKKHGI
ncbi:hypothetical protein [Streptomyces fuscigenes]|uniref:hypothetical protein n=1 Tax=Streptomyces fuscigenes TaxID=1528880 RepID=UPI001F3CFB0B|nr:hypothetical protein [Streptomyces fuscigenes]MCF3964351.1 hypothetical protein [Streptomyces fuscigenes]